jgi:DNA-binding XRE family transcriptional regulator
MKGMKPPRGWVYLMLAGVHYKIGSTTDTERRHVQLDVGAVPLEVVHCFPSKIAARIETTLHRHFRDKRARREWFLLSDEDVASITSISACDSFDDLPPGMRASIPPAYRDERYVTDFSVSLTRIRRQRGMSQTDLARAIGVTRPAVSRMEAGASNPSLAVLVALADALGCTIDELCGRTNP